jgi:hypothetical protein
MTEAKPQPGSLEQRDTKELDRRSMIEWGDLRPWWFLASAAHQPE